MKAPGQAEQGSVVVSPCLCACVGCGLCGLHLVVAPRGRKAWVFMCDNVCVLI